MIRLSLFGVVGIATCVACKSSYVEQTHVQALSEQVWLYSQGHPDGFTLNLRTMTEPTDGIAVGYAATQNSYSHGQLPQVVNHALSHDGFVGGWYNRADGLYTFDSTRLFPETDLAEAIQFGLDNDQHSLYILSSETEIPIDGAVSRIVKRGKLLVGTTGDYRPLSFCEPATNEFWGFGIDLARELADRLGVGITFVKTSWPTLSSDVKSDVPTFDLAIGGITITHERRQTMLMSNGYMANGKTILCRAADAERFQSLKDIDRNDVRVMVNPGGLNERFARESLKKAVVLVHEKNEDIPELVATGQADVMITEITEAPYYLKADTRLAAPLLNAPFTHGEIGVLMRKGQEDLLQFVNNVISQMKEDGTLRRLHEKYGLVYVYE